MREMNIYQCQQVSGGTKEWIEHRAQLIGAVSATIGGIGCGILYAPMAYLDNFGKPQSFLSISFKAFGVASLSAGVVYCAAYYASKKGLELSYGAV